MTVRVHKIISGGQTGVDRAALDFALANGILTGGYVPKGRLAEDGRIPAAYMYLMETRSDDLAERTGGNISISHATLIISQGPLSGGSKLTEELAKKANKPVLHIDLSGTEFNDQVDKARGWLDTIKGGILNVAGPRASEDGEIYGKARDFLEVLLAQ